MSFEVTSSHRNLSLLLKRYLRTQRISATSTNGLHMLFSRFIGIVPVEAMEWPFIGFVGSADKQHCLYERYCKI